MHAGSCRTRDAVQPCITTLPRIRDASKKKYEFRDLSSNPVPAVFDGLRYQAPKVLEVYEASFSESGTVGLTRKTVE